MNTAARLQALYLQLQQDTPVATALREAAHEAPEAWTRFLQRNAHLIEQGRSTALLQAAADEPPPSPLSDAARAISQQNGERLLTRLHPSAAPSRCLRTIDNQCPLRRLWLFAGHLLSCDDRWRLRAWDPTFGTLRWEQPLPPQAAGLVELSWALVAYGGGWVWLLDKDSGDILQQLGCPWSITAVAEHQGKLLACGPGGAALFGQDGARRAAIAAPEGAIAPVIAQERLLFGDKHGQVHSFSFAGDALGTWRAHEEPLLFMALHDDQRRLLTAAGREIVLWDLDGPRRVHAFTEHSDTITGLALPPGAELFLSSAHDGHLKRWDLQTGACLASMLLQTGNSQDGTGITHLALDPTGKLLSMTQTDLRDTVTGGEYLNSATVVLAVEEHRAFCGDTEPSVLRCGDGQVAVTRWSDLLLYSPRSPQARTLSGHQRQVRALAASESTLFSGSEDGTIKLWELREVEPEGGERASTAAAKYDHISQLFFSPDGATLLARGEKPVHLIDVQRGERLKNTSEGVGLVMSSTINARCALLAIYEPMLRVFAPDTGEVLHVLDWSGGELLDLDLSPCGRLLLGVGQAKRNTSTPQGIACLWDLESGARLFTWSEALFSQGRFSPDGHAVYLFGESLEVYTRRGAHLRSHPLPAQVTRVARHPDADRALVWASPHLLLLDLTSGAQEPITLDKQRGLKDLCVLSDGRAVTLSDKKLTVWTDPPQELTLASGLWGQALLPLDAGRCLILTSDGHLITWDPQHGQRLSEQRRDSGYLRSLLRLPLEPDAVLAVGYGLYTLELPTAALRREVKMQVISALEWGRLTPDSARFVGVSKDTTLHVIDAQSRQETRLPCHLDGTLGPFWPDGSAVIVGHNRLELASGACTPLPQALVYFKRVAFCAGERVAMGVRDGRLVSLDLESAAELKLGEPSEGLRLLASPRPGRIVSVDDAGQLCFWDTHAQALHQQIGAFNERPSWWCFSSAGDVLVAQAGATIKAWSHDGEQLWEREAPPARAAAVQPSGPLLAVCGEDKTLRLLDLRSGALRASWYAGLDLRCCALSAQGVLAVVDGLNELTLLRLHP